jgi:hypothetical protein
MSPASVFATPVEQGNTRPWGGAMFVLWGTTARQKVVRRGAFFCPSCREQCAYSLVAVRKYFHIYFLPLFQTGTLGEYLLCEGCGGQYDTAALRCDASDFRAALQPWECPVCGNRNPGESRDCLRCGRWLCRHCGRDNPEKSKECLLCRRLRAG